MKKCGHNSDNNNTKTAGREKGIRPMDWGLRAQWDDANRRKTLAISLAHVKQWAEKTTDCFDPETMRNAGHAAQIARALVESASDPSVALKYMDGCREDFWRLLELEHRLHERPTGDPHRCNPVVRTALRRVGDYLEKIGATFQYC